MRQLDPVTIRLRSRARSYLRATDSLMKSVRTSVGIANETIGSMNGAEAAREDINRALETAEFLVNTLKEARRMMGLEKRHRARLTPPPDVHVSPSEER